MGPKKTVTERKLTKGDFVLTGDVKIDDYDTIKKGAKFNIKKDSAIASKISRKDPSAFSIQGEILEVIKDVSINIGRVITKGTVLNITDDKELIESLKKINPRLLGEEMKVQEIKMEIGTGESKETEEEEDDEEEEE